MSSLLENRNLLLGVGAAAVAAGVGYALYRRSRQKPAAEQPTTTTTSAPPVPPTAPISPAPPILATLVVNRATLLYDQLPTMETSSIIMTLPVGGSVAVLDQQGVWMRVRYPARRGTAVHEGWVDANALGPRATSVPSPGSVDFGGVVSPAPRGVLTRIPSTGPSPFLPPRASTGQITSSRPLRSGEDPRLALASFGPYAAYVVLPDGRQGWTLFGSSR